MNELYQLYGIERSRTTPYHPQGNGACERFNRTLIQMLRTLENGQKARWPEYLPELMWAYNNRVHNTTGYSPHMLMFGRAGREVEDLHMPDPKEPQPRSATAWMQEHRRRLRAIHKVVGERLEQVVHPAPGPVQRDSYSPGDRVMVRAKRPSGKLDGRWEAVPYMVKRRVDPDIPVYEVEPVGTGGPSRNLHRNMLRQCNFDEPIIPNARLYMQIISMASKDFGGKNMALADSDEEYYRFSGSGEDTGFKVEVSWGPSKCGGSREADKVWQVHQL
ncbi:uncharacterized protein PAF06_015342 [Gastrophryne carolinensis]